MKKRIAAIIFMTIFILCIHQISSAKFCTMIKLVGKDYKNYEPIIAYTENVVTYTESGIVSITIKNNEKFRGTIIVINGIKCQKENIGFIHRYIYSTNDEN